MKPTEKTIREAVERYGPSVIRRCQAFTADRHLADDLAQEVFARVCEVVARPDRNREDVPWKLIEGVMKNIFLEYLGRKKKTPLLQSTIGRSTEYGDDPAERMQAEDWADKVRGLVEHLSAPEQQAVLGRHFLGMNIAELTRFLGLPRSTVVDYYNRGINRLREMARDHKLLP